MLDLSEDLHMIEREERRARKWSREKTCWRSKQQRRRRRTRGRCRRPRWRKSSRTAAASSPPPGTNPSTPSPSPSAGDLANAQAAATHPPTEEEGGGNRAKTLHDRTHSHFTLSLSIDNVREKQRGVRVCRNCEGDGFGAVERTSLDLSL